MYIIFWAISIININTLNKMREVNLKYKVKYTYVWLSSDIHSDSDITRMDSDITQTGEISNLFCRSRIGWFLDQAGKYILDRHIFRDCTYLYSITAWYIRFEY